MSTVSQPTEFELFVQFAQDQLNNGAREMSPEDSVELWRKRRKEVLDRLMEELRPALEQSERGEVIELDIEELISRGTERLAEKGIAD